MDRTKLRRGLTFSRKGSQNHALQKVLGRRAKRPSGGDDGFYELLAGHRVAISSTHPDVRPWREVFSCRCRGTTSTSS